MTTPASEDVYVLLGLETTATAAEIRKGYRQKSLKVHPDRNPDNPDAANLFHALTEAADLLLDPGKRAEYDKKYAAEKARKERFAALDNKRKAGLADLEEREKSFKRQEMDRERELSQARQVENLKEQAAKMRMQRQQQAQEQQSKSEKENAQSREAQQKQNSGVLDLGPLDTTLLLSFPKSLFDSADSLRSHLAACAPASAVENIVYSDKKSKKQKLAKAVVAFNTLAATIAIYKAMTKSDLASKGVDVKWASGEPPAPARKALGLDVTPQAQPTKSSTGDAPSSFPPRPNEAPNEADILKRMAERQRLEEEIRKSEAAES